MKLKTVDGIARDLRAQLEAIGKSLDSLAAEVESAKAERDGFISLLYAARRDYRHAVAHAGKSGNRIERSVRVSYLKAQDFGFRGTMKDWEDLLRLGS